MALKIGDALLHLGIDMGDLETGLKKAESSIETSLKKHQTELRAVGTAMTAVGVASLKMISDSKQLNAQFAQTALTVGVSTQEMRDLALATTDVTFPLESVQKTFELLAKSGVKDAKQMQLTAKAFDALADATGSSADAVADLLLPAFKLFGEELPTTSRELDKFTWLTKNTLVDLSDFGTLLTRMAPYMDDLNMSMDDAIATLAALSEQGIVGSAATMKLRTAITQAASGAVTLNDALGLTQDQIDGYKRQMTGAIGVTDKYAEAANSQFGIMDNLKQTFAEFSLRVGTALEPLEAISAALSVLGPIFLFLSTSIGVSTVKWIASTSAMVAHKVAAYASAAGNYVVTTSFHAMATAAASATVAVGRFLAIVAAGLVVVTAQLVTEWWAISKLREALGGPKAADNPWEEFLGWLGKASEGLAVLEAAVVKATGVQVPSVIPDTGKAAKGMATQIDSATTSIEDYIEQMRLAADDKAFRDFGQRLDETRQHAADIASGWERLLRDMDPLVERYNQFGITAQDVLRALAKEAGVSLMEMAERLNEAGIDVNNLKYHLGELRIGIDKLDGTLTVGGNAFVTYSDGVKKATNSVTDFIKALEESIAASIKADSQREASLKALGITRPGSREESEGWANGVNPNKMTQSQFDQMWREMIGNAGALLEFDPNASIAEILRGWGITPEMAAEYGKEWPTFGQGGIVTQPMMLSGLGGGRRGIMAENGPEAIVPLTEMGFKTANIVIEMDGRAFMKLMGTRLTEEIRLKQGLRL